MHREESYLLLSSGYVVQLAKTSKRPAPFKAQKIHLHIPDPAFTQPSNLSPPPPSPSHPPTLTPHHHYNPPTHPARLEKSRSQRILWLLTELDVPYDLQTYKRQSMLAPPELKEIHPLGKSPLVTISTPSAAPLVLAESSFIVEYLIDHFGPRFAPARYESGKEGQVGGETEAWVRYRYYMHYAEGSLMPYLLVGLLLSSAFFSSRFLSLHPFPPPPHH